ncbi:unnamed protein product [Rotaria sordida]|uniref:EF-hand domain-containing protein n=1 Tax=Rotaria sordida TaxID=392033 RepID=A0A813S5Z3_9BILA|nr:unnamed protein product [Rotaria sordida]CAF0791697.1 unnamed protein product [Rotaria sordida]CAF0810799.1 unnamed protein product [Rotaria sordida]CAF0820193.1 unnamed protein product [Rotaria sordida]CAF0822095.1 unnamed protein product [Rotaria sordida]
MEDEENPQLDDSIDNENVDNKNIDNENIDNKNIDNENVDNEDIDNEHIDNEHIDNENIDKENIDNEDIDQEMIELNAIFSRFKDDPNEDFINVNRLTQVLQAFGRNPSLKDSEQRINELEAAEKFELTLEDVLQITNESWTAINNDRDGLRQALEKFDPTQEGYIDIEKFRTIMTTLGEPLTDEELDDLIQLGLNDEQTKINIDYLLDQLLGNNT